LHRECFDLETFLLTRKSKPKRPDQPTMVDVWKCPLCGVDARPYHLQVDEFLVSVRKELKERGLLDTKSIWIAADGKWRPKEEPKSSKRKARSDSFDSDSSNFTDVEANIQSKNVAGTSKRSKVIEVIDLDDD